jgi:hypothetical protein
MTNRIDAKKMVDIARGFSPSVGGNHTRRGGCDEGKMREVLSDWFDEDLYRLDQPSALKRLEEIFSHSSVNMKLISSKMKMLREASDSVSERQIVPKILLHADSTDGGISPAVMFKTSISAIENFKKSFSTSIEDQPALALPMPEETHYNMQHEKRGKALIFNHKAFDEKRDKHLSKRPGTEIDAVTLNETLTNLGFDVSIHTDPDLDEICKHLERAAAAEDNIDSDCILVAVLSHGHDSGKISAWDQEYEEETLWKAFLGEKARRLRGKPKVFIIQACRGTERDEGVELDGAEEGSSTGGKIPSHADFLIARATVPGQVSFRNSLTGTYYIQELCAVLLREAYTDDLVSILTKVQGNMARKTMQGRFKQGPSFTSRLTKKLQLVKKSEQE